MFFLRFAVIGCFLPELRDHSVPGGCREDRGDHKLSINCAFPPELDDKQLFAYLEGEASQEVLSHLQDCVYCRQKAKALDHFKKRLTSRIYRLTCPSPIELGEYHLRMLPASQILVVRQHLDECPHCVREIAQLEHFLNDQAPAPKDSLLEHAKVLVARLVGEGGFTFASASAALRGEGKGPITFAAEGIIIVLDVQSTAEGKVNILGQVAADNQDDWTGALVELRRNNLLQISTPVDDLGAFRCEGVISGQQELRIIPRNGSVVVLSNFEIPN